MRSAYNDPRAAEWLSERAKIPVITAGLHGRGQRQGAGSVRAFRRHARAPADGSQMNFAAARSGHPRARTSSRVCWSPRRTPRSACRCLNRGIVFIDLAIAQVAGLGVIFADSWGSSRRAGACRRLRSPRRSPARCFLTWTEKHWPEVQEAIIGRRFHPGGERRAAAPRGQSARRRAPQGTAGRADPVGELAAPRAGSGRLCGAAGALVRHAANGWAASASICVRCRGDGFGAARRPLSRFHDTHRARACDPSASPRAACRLLRAGRGRLCVGLLASAVLDLPSGAVIVWALALFALPVVAYGGKQARAH